AARSNRSILARSTPATDACAATAASASAGVSNTARTRPIADPIIRPLRRPATGRCSASLDERLDLADQALERLAVVWRRLLGDDGVEPELHVRREPFRELPGCAVPEGRVVGDVGEWRLVVLHRGLPDPVGLGLAVANRCLDSEGEFDRRRIATDVLAVLAEHLNLVAHQLERAHRVPQIGVASDRPESLLLARPPDHDREVRLDWRRLMAQVVERVVGARL